MAVGPFTVPVAWTFYQSWKKGKIRHFWSRNWLVCGAKKKKARPLPISVTLTSMVNRGHPKQQEHCMEHETIHIQLCSGVGGRLPFSITGDTWKTPRSVALTTLMNPLASLCGKVRVERHHVLLSFCSSGWCGLIVPQRGVSIYAQCAFVCEDGEVRHIEL